MEKLILLIWHYCELMCTKLNHNYQSINMFWPLWNISLKLELLKHFLYFLVSVCGYYDPVTMNFIEIGSAIREEKKIHSCPLLHKWIQYRLSRGGNIHEIVPCIKTYVRLSSLISQLHLTTGKGDFYRRKLFLFM